MDSDIKNEQKSQDVYYNPKTEFQSEERLCNKALEDGLSITRKQVKKWLKVTGYVHQIQTFVDHLGEQIRIDLIDMGKCKNQNKGCYWILTATEILSRLLYLSNRKDKSNMAKVVIELLRQFKNRVWECSKLSQFDDGKTLLEKHNIKYVSLLSDKKAAVAERFNRTLNATMWKYFYIKGTYKWIDKLDDLVYKYNNTDHSTILMR